MSGTTAVVGVPCDSSSARGVNGDPTQLGAPCSGAAYVFVRQADTWVLQAYLKASNADPNDAFGTAVAISGDTIVVGAPGEDSAATSVNGDSGDNSALDAGAAYVFVRRGTTWTQDAYLKGASTPGAGFDGMDVKGVFGTSVAVSGDTIAVAAFDGGRPSRLLTTRAGSLYVFVRTAATWVQQAHMHGESEIRFNPLSTNYSVRGSDSSYLAIGRALALSGDTLMVSGMVPAGRMTACVNGRTSRHGNGEDAVFVFVRTGTTWREEACLVRDVAPDTGSDPVSRLYPEPSDLPAAEVWYDDFGAALALNGDTLLVGAPREIASDIPRAIFTGGTRGVSYIFRRGASGWSKEARLLAPAEWKAEGLGTAVALQGDTALIGTTDDAAAVFTRDAARWTPTQHVRAAAGEPSDRFGAAVALSDAGALIGAPGRGGVYDFRVVPFGLTPGALTVGAAGGLATVLYRAMAPDAEWTVSVLPPWLSIAPSSGRGSTVLTLTVAAQGPGGAARTGSVTLGTAMLSVSQAAAPAVTFEDAREWVVPGTGGITTVSIRAAPGTPWTATSGASWLNVAPTTGTGNAVLTLWTSGQSPDDPVRSTSLSLGAQAMVVRQLRFQAPEPPSHLQATVADTQLTLSWDLSTAPVDVRELRIEYGTVPGQTRGAISVPATTREWTVFAPPGRYFLRLHSANSVGRSAPSSEVEVQVGQPVGPPGRPHALSASIEGQRVALTWTRPADTRPVTGYLVEAGPPDPTTAVGSMPVGLTTTYAVDDVPPGLYRVRVRAINDAGIGEPSEELLVAVGGVPPLPGRPAVLPPSRGPLMMLYWSAPTSGGPPLGYVLEVGSREGLSDLGQIPVSGTSLSFRNDALPPGLYWIRIRAVGASGLGPASNDVPVRLPQ